ncbi:MAG: hypothetical protein R3B90_20810 [Planctomycetaceae bacterium]
MTSSRVPPSALSILRRSRLWSLAVACSCMVRSIGAIADDGPSARPSLADELASQDDTWIMTPNNSGSIAGGAPLQGEYGPTDIGSFGVNARAGHLAGSSVGRVDPMTYFELSPFTTFDNVFLAGDFRVLRTNSGEVASSAGVILRRYLPRRNSIAGFNVYFDNDGSRGPTLQDIGIGFEYLTPGWDFRLNGVIPINNTTKRVATAPIRGSETFLGNQLYFDQLTTQITNSGGLDMTLTAPLPGQLATRLNLEASAGAYYYAPTDSNVRDFIGWKARLDTTLAKRLLHGFIEASGDRVNDNMVAIGVDINYWRRYDDQPRAGGNSYHRINEWVRRNWTSVAVDEASIAQDILATDAAGNAFFFEHVDSNAAPGGNGTFENPFRTLQQAQGTPPNAPASIIFAHAGSVFNTPLVMNPNEIILGEGATNTINTFGMPGGVFLPSTGKAGGKPVFDNITGTPVTLASNTTFGGFDISDTTGGPAILGDGISSATLYDINIVNVDGGDGIVFRNAGGTVRLNNVNMFIGNPSDPTTGVGGDNFVVENNNARIIYTNSTINNAIGRAVRISDSAGSVNMGTTLVNSRTTTGLNLDQGVLVENSSTDVTFGPMTLQNGSIDLTNISGNVTFVDSIDIRNSNNPFTVNGSTGTVLFAPGAPLSIIDRGGTGVDLRNISGLFRFDDDITITGTSVGANDFTSPALVWQQNTGRFLGNGNFTAGTQTVNFATQSTGILIGDRLGLLANQAPSSFRMNGQVNIFNTWAIDPLTTAPESAIEILNDPTNVTFNGLQIDGRNPDVAALGADSGGIEILNTTGSLRFLGLTQINNEPIDPFDPLFNLPSAESALEATGATGPIYFENLTIADATENAFLEPAVFMFGNGDITFDELNVVFTGGGAFTTPAVHIEQNGIVTARGGTLTGIAARAINLIDNQEIAWTSDTINAANDQFGIFVSGQPGHFVVRGRGAAGSGGLITGMNVRNAPQIADYGAFFDFTGEDPTDTDNFVVLQDMVFSGANDRAIAVVNANRFELNNSTVTTTTGIGVGPTASAAVALEDVINVSIADSVFTSNTNEDVLATIAISPAATVFNYQFLRNRFDDGAATSTGSNMVTIDNFGGAGSNLLNLLVQDNGGPTSGVIGFNSSRTNAALTDTGSLTDSSALGVRWNGALNAVIERNSFALLGGQGQEGVEIVTGDASALTRVTFRQNTLVTNEPATGATLTNPWAIGAKFDFAGPAELNIIENGLINTPGQPFTGFRLAGPASEAFRVTLRSAGNLVRLRGNDIDLAGDDSVGFNIPFVGGNTQFEINRNVITHNVNNIASGPGEDGFRFGPVFGTAFFSGTDFNTVEYLAGIDNFSNPFPSPFIGAHQGFFFLNGQRVPQ